MRRMGILAAAVVLVLQAPAWPRAVTEAVDVTSEGEAPDEELGASSPPVISRDGRWVAFASVERLTPDDQTDSVDVYVRDLVEDRTILVTPVPEGDEAYRVHYDVSISDDGRFVAFVSQGDVGLVPEDTNREDDVYVKDLRTGTLVVASAPEGEGAPAGGRDPVMFGRDGWVAFVGNALTRDDRTETSDIYFRDVTSSEVELAVGYTHRRGSFENVDVSDDGSRVAYVGDGALWVYDRTTGRRVRADVNNRGEPASHAWPFENIALSGNGRVVAFASTADNLSRFDRNGNRPDVYARDLLRKRTEILSVYANGRTSNEAKDSWSVSISRSGRFVAFGSNAVLAGKGPDDGEFDVFVRDRLDRRTLHASSGCGQAGHPSLSGDARWIAFVSDGCASVGGAATLFARGPLRRP